MLLSPSVFIVNSQVLMLTITPAISLVLSFVLELIIVWEGLYKVKVETQSQISYEIDFEIIHFKKSDSTLYDIWYIFKLLFTDLCWPYRSVYDKWLIVPSKVIARLHVIWPPTPHPLLLRVFVPKSWIKNINILNNFTSSLTVIYNN